MASVLLVWPRAPANCAQDVARCVRNVTHAHTHSHIFMHACTWCVVAPWTPSLRGRFVRCTANTICFLHMLSCVCVRSKAWLAARVSRRLARRSCRLRTTLAAAPVVFAHGFGPFHMEKTYEINGTSCVVHLFHLARRSACLFMSQAHGALSTTSFFMPFHFLV